MACGNFSGADFCGANLFGADLRKAGLSGCHFEHADLRGADFCRARGLDTANLSFTDLRGADLRGTGVEFGELARASARFEGARCGHIEEEHPEDIHLYAPLGRDGPRIDLSWTREA